MPASDQHGNAPVDSHRAPPLDKVKLYSHVEIELVDASGGSERLAFDIVPDEQADFYSGLLGVSAPLARAILEQPVGSLARYDAGEPCQVRILSAHRIESSQASEAAARRKAAADEARKQVERTNAMIFATTVEGKWGEYDADGMMENWE
ncbi:MAG: GreA/GreB family elongation factor [Anaerolineales bacterium]|nr:GreA/GreB family elongation factor [Anaerolineales bacterium]